MPLFALDEKIHIVIRRLFPEDLRRHFVGEVKKVEGAIVRIEGYTFVFNRSTNKFVKRPDRRSGIFNLAESGYIVNVLPYTVKLEDIKYVDDPKEGLTVTDGKTYSLLLNEFNPRT